MVTDGVDFMDLTDLGARICEVLPHQVASGSYQMAFDAALLERAAERGDRAVIRTYEWSKPTLSLGYFQKYECIEGGDAMSVDAIVRRPTGGGAIRHDRDLTFAVVAPSVDRRSSRPAAYYRVVHGAIAALLREHSVDASLRGAVDPVAQADKPFLCFRDCDASDVVVSGVKIVGGAQRRTKDATLLHGSMRLRGVGSDCDLAGLADVSRGTDSVEFWARLFRERLPDLLGWERLDTEIDADFGRRVRELAERVFMTEEWTRKR